MQANPRTIDKLFNSQSRYIVPMFQRLYVWQENPQWTTLWEDLAEKAALRLDGKQSNPHYLGALIIEGVKPTSANEVTRMLVIDGQQRLTTIQLLLCAFRDIAKQNAWVALEKKANRYIENPDPDTMENPDEEIFKLWPTQLNRRVFSSIITSGGKEEVEKRYPLIRRKYQRKPDPRSNLVEAYLFFFDRLLKWIVRQAEERQIEREACAFQLLQAVQQDFCVVEISLSDGDDSQEIFYSLNSQGRPLSQSDLLRSLIFMRAEKESEDRDALFTDFWGEFETAFWNVEVKRGGRTYTKLDMALRHFLTVKTGSLIDTRRVNEEYKSWSTSQPPPYASVRAELAELTRFSDAYKRLDGDHSGAVSTDIGRVIQDFDVSTVLPLVLFIELEAGLDPGEQSLCLGMVQSFLVRRALIGAETKEYNKLFVEVVASLRDLRGDAIRSNLENKLTMGRGSTRVWPSDAQIIEHAMTMPLYGQLRPAGLRVILERLELSLRGKKTEDEKVAANLQIEHIMPQSWAARWPLDGETIHANWAKYSFLIPADRPELGEKIRARNALVNSLGNLSLLNKYANPAASNGDLQLKLLEYKNSVLRLNRYFDTTTVWDEAAIRRRGQLLGQMLCKLYPRSAGSPFDLILDDEKVAVPVV